MQLVLGDTRCVVGGATVISGTQSTVILGPINLYNYGHKSFTVYNAGSVTLSGAIIQVNPDHHGQEFTSVPANPSAPVVGGPNPALWETIDTTSYQSLGPGAVKSVQLSNNTYKWWQVVGTSNAGGSTTVTTSGWCYARSV